MISFNSHGVFPADSKVKTFGLSPEGTEDMVEYTESKTIEYAPPQQLCKRGLQIPWSLFLEHSADGKDY